jgi:hypothetical protein
MAEEKSSDPSTVFEQFVKQDNEDVRFFVLEVGEDGEAMVVAQGQSFEAFQGAFDSNKVQWGGFCCHGIDRRGNVDSIRTKVIKVNWVGEDVSPMKRMTALSGAGKAGDVFAGAIACEINANSAEDIDLKETCVKLADCGGAHKPTVYEFGGGVELSLADIGKDTASDRTGL